ncbi:serine/threonine-protein kinase [Herbidospora mongoliensis]|uniref:serine/threonine-protein kinase n=1 Tax=Herbidospora mongoliensis TaxID=688067 RepID=UPI00082D7D36|nr:serine/threonine-protein kinase [Herbidospora mongoliensis]
MKPDRPKPPLLGDRYQMTIPIRRDGSGIMWQAHDLLLKRDVAIKEVQPPHRTDRLDMELSRRKALSEARSAARLSHPAIITIHDLLEENGRLWIVTEFLEGLTLKQTIEHLGSLPVHWSAWIGYQLLAGVRHAHDAGVVHGDIKPGNVLLTGDRVVLTDFGISALGHESTARAARSVDFIAPERMAGQPASPAADLWSVGATIYAAVEGRPPYPATGATVLGLTSGLEHDPPSKAGALLPVLDGLLRRGARDRLPGRDVSMLLAGLLHREGIAAATPGRRADYLPPDAFTM